MVGLHGFWTVVLLDGTVVGQYFCVGYFHVISIWLVLDVCPTIYLNVSIYHMFAI